MVIAFQFRSTLKVFLMAVIILEHAADVDKNCFFQLPNCCALTWCSRHKPALILSP
jgi:hypothetical protein